MSDKEREEARRKADAKGYSDRSTTSGWAVFGVMIAILILLIILAIFFWMFVMGNRNKSKKQRRNSIKGTKPLVTCCGCTTYPECWCVQQKNSLSDIANVAAQIDPSVVNSWGIAIDDCCHPPDQCHKCCEEDSNQSWSQDSQQNGCKKKKEEWSTDKRVWVADNGTGVLEEFRLHCTDCQLKWKQTVAVPGPSIDITTGSPTGVVVNCDCEAFQFSTNSGQGSAQVITVTEQGTINVYNPSVDPNTTFIVYNGFTDGKVFKGVDLAKTRLYVAEFHFGNVEVYDDDFKNVLTFTDPDLVAIGYAPFNVKVIDGLIYVAFAKQDDAAHDDVSGQGNGYVDVFDCSGTLLYRLISRGALNSPWALTPLCDNTMLLVGNFGDGRLNVYDIKKTNTLLHPLQDIYRNPISIDGLWGVVPVPSKRCGKWSCKEECERSKDKPCNVGSICCCSQHASSSSGGEQREESCDDKKKKKDDCHS
jgi:uncharacterized protein (TIGR03118 family)